MANSMYFVQECPTCGRRLQIRVEYLGREVVCQHCRGKLLARDPESHRYPDSSEAENLLRRAEELLRDASRHVMAHNRLPYPR
jgi:DNA-directed RNA polymerase subunit RPC12/RpoP